MPGARRIVGLTVALLALTAPPAVAKDYCVDVVRDQCTASPTLEAALAESDRTTVYLGAGTYDAAEDGGRAVTIIGLGPEQTKLAGDVATPALRLTAPGSAAEQLGLERAELDVA